MSTFDEYAALVRHLSVQQRADEQGVAAEADRRRDLGAAVDYLDRRLSAQGQRLDQLGRTLGVSPPPVGPQPSTAPVSGPPGAPVSSGPPANGTGWDGGVAAAPGRPGVGAYSQGGVGEAERALPVAVRATAAGVPGQRVGEVDPATELEMVRRWADEADRYAQQTEVLAQRPALLPSWSPMARAIAVYLGFAAVSVLIMLVMVLASGIGVVGGWTLFSWMCAGLPAASLIGGWLVLGRWGRPAVGATTAPRYPVIGFLLCFLAVPLAYCGYLILIRTLR
ncbi:hypothetical protein [Micromonospora sp. NBC_01739]|uniref:hypothetical protein n=1 Tax=Micromonospora sp. NBC_01739 TaxID=2975985 RepID=UPI002E16569B|nr:hypothetical protein OIE53_02330 [Micromonospora sp. NBC_01739]